MGQSRSLCEIDLALLNAKELPNPLEKQIRERMAKLKRSRGARP